MIGIGRRKTQLDRAAAMGADELLISGDTDETVEHVRELTGGRGADIAIEAVGNPEVWETAAESLRRGGIVNFFGGCPNDSKIQLDTQLAALLGNHLQGQLPPHAGAHPQGAGFREPRRDHRARFRQPRGAAHQSAGSDAAPDEPQRSHEDRDHTLVPLARAQRVRQFARGAERHLHASRKPSSTRAGWPPIITKISTSSGFCCPSACTRISTTSIRSAAGRTIWATRSATRPRACACWRGGAGTGSDVRGHVQHPVFVALEGTAHKYDLPKQLFADLISAFEQDQRVTRYENWDELFDYCRCSANPVGRLVLRLCGYADDERDRLSDATCTALQLANFWQDVTVDLEKDRVYLPLDVLARHGYTVADLRAGTFNPAFQAVMREAVDVARKLFLEGLPLVKTVNRRLAFDLDLFSRGGMRVLEKIEQQNYNVLARVRPSPSSSASSCCVGSLWTHAVNAAETRVD